MAEFIPCAIRTLPPSETMEAARDAIKINPANAPRVDVKAMAAMGAEVKPEALAILTQKYWGPSGVQLTVSFLDNPSTSLRKNILMHMNAWNERANVDFRFVETGQDPQVRIARLSSRPNESYVGTDILRVARSQHTMNLRVTDNTTDGEMRRIIRHEAGHTLGFEHEHLRQELVDRISPAKAYAYFAKSPNYWTREQVDLNVLTPLDEGNAIMTELADQDSIMCYQLPGDITTDREPIVGGLDINATDHAFAGLLYPKAIAAPGGDAGSGRASQLTLEDFLEAAARAAHRAVNREPQGKGKIFVGIVASHE